MIGKVIESLLNVAAVNTLVPLTSRYMHFIKDDTPLPAIVYKPESTTVEYTKDGWAGDTAPFSIGIFASTYTSLQDIALEVRIALELKSGTYSDVEINKIYLTGQTEGVTDDGVYGTVMKFTTNIKGY